ncbi:MAG: ABC transporter permease, partial [Bacteroidales bacterium]|nr:ABC transporter permease [Bacteroidales bacterium]
LYAGMFCMENPDGPLAFWCSMIPFTSPVVMMIRLPYDLPWYELVMSLVILYASAFGILWLSSRIYRTGILMYGRKFTIKEILRWIK